MLTFNCPFNKWFFEDISLLGLCHGLSSLLRSWPAMLLIPILSSTCSCQSATPLPPNLLRLLRFAPSTQAKFFYLFLHFKNLRKAFTKPKASDFSIKTNKTNKQTLKKKTNTSRKLVNYSFFLEHILVQNFRHGAPSNKSLKEEQKKNMFPP